MTAVMSTMQQCFWMLPAGPTEISPCSWPVMVRIFWFQLRRAHDGRLWRESYHMLSRNSLHGHQSRDSTTVLSGLLALCL